jgi:hypothetical protein
MLKKIYVGPKSDDLLSALRLKKERPEGRYPRKEVGKPQSN